MSKFLLSNHRVTVSEWTLVPVTFYELLKARLEVSLCKAEDYFPGKQFPGTTSANPVHNKKAQDIATVVNGIARRTPWRSTCLVKALAAHKLLSRKQIRHSIHFGVQRLPAQNLKAHAWVSVGGKIIIGGLEVSEFTEIRRLDFC